MKKPLKCPQKPSQRPTHALAQVDTLEGLEQYLASLKMGVRASVKELSSVKRKDRSSELKRSIREGRELINNINNIIYTLRNTNE